MNMLECIHHAGLRVEEVCFFTSVVLYELKRNEEDNHELES
jgi:hypothetical protein